MGASAEGGVESNGDSNSHSVDGGLDSNSAASAGDACTGDTCPGTTPPPNFVRVEGSGFVLKGKPWHPIGANYWPHYAQPYYLDSKHDWLTMWGDPTFPTLDAGALIDQDFALMQANGINEIRLESSYVLENSWPPFDPTTYPTPQRSICMHINQLLDMAQTHDIHVTWVAPVGRTQNPNGTTYIQWMANPSVFKIAASQVVAEQYESLSTSVIRACNLSQHPALLGYTIDLESSAIVSGGADSSDEALELWNAWLSERYGSIANAEARFGYGLTHCTTSTGTAMICPPPDSTLTDDQDPGHRAGKAYRRFMASVLNRRFQRLVDLIKNLSR
jgi:hypothetical protein